MPTGLESLRQILAEEKAALNLGREMTGYDPRAAAREEKRDDDSASVFRQLIADLSDFIAKLQSAGENTTKIQRSELVDAFLAVILDIYQEKTNISAAEISNLLTDDQYLAELSRVIDRLSLGTLESQLSSDAKIARQALLQGITLKLTK
jgi:hypothetical protein